MVRLPAQICGGHEISSLKAAVEMRKIAEAGFERDCGDRPGRIARARQHTAGGLEPSFEGKVRESGSGLLEQHLDITRRNSLTRGKPIKAKRSVLDQITLDCLESCDTDASLIGNLPALVRRADR